MIDLKPRHWRYALYRSHVNLVSEASRYYLGWLWWFLEPLAMAAVFFVVFTYLRPRGPGFMYFLIIGVTTWLWFSNSVANSTQSLSAAKSLILQMRLPKLLFPLIGILMAGYKQVFVFTILLLVIASTTGVQWSWLAFPVLVVVQGLLIAAVAPAVALVCTLVPDFRFLVVSGLQLMMFCSGIFFDIDDLPETVQYWFRLNPMAVALEQYRDVLLHGQLPDFIWCLSIATGSIVAILATASVLQRYDQDITRRVIAL